MQAQLTAAVAELDSVIAEVDHMEVTADLARTAGEFAQAHRLRGYDAVHLAAAQIVADEDLVLVTGDLNLVAAARAVGMAVVLTKA